MKSLGAMIKKLHGMVGTADLSEWETDFVQNVYDRSGEGLNSLIEMQTNLIYTRQYG